MWLCQSDTYFFLPYPLLTHPSYSLPIFMEQSGRARGWEERGGWSGKPGRGITNWNILSFSLPLFYFKHTISTTYLMFCLFACQTAKEEEEKVEDGMWEETFKSHSDSKPNGKSYSYSHFSLIFSAIISAYVSEEVLVKKVTSCFHICTGTMKFSRLYPPMGELHVRK